MLIAAAKLTLRAPWVRSLKEKRMIVQSLIARVSQKFHVSAAEVEQQDVHQTIVVGVAAVVGSAALGDAVLDKIRNGRPGGEACCSGTRLRAQSMRF